MNKKHSPYEWSVLECIEHLNLYGSFYLPVIENAILSQKTVINPMIFKSGIIGNYFVNLIKIRPGKAKKMSAVKDMTPVNRHLTITTIERFLKQQEKLELLLNKAKYVDMARAKTPISISKFIKLRLGDTLRFMVYHIERHVVQANNVHTN
ncbi:DinB superfamily protein [compost metagenome]